MKKVLIDTNLLLLFLLGSVDRKHVGNHKRLRGFSDFEFEALLKLLASATQFVTTPHILAETSNLLDIGKRADVATANAFITFVQAAEEICVSAEDVTSRPEFLKYGLTDAAIHSVVAERISVLTVDFPLYGSLLNIGVDVTNVRHIYLLGDERGKC